jgi:hypothetical protein
MRRQLQAGRADRGALRAPSPGEAGRRGLVPWPPRAIHSLLTLQPASEIDAATGRGELDAATDGEEVNAVTEALDAATDLNASTRL